jgi:MPBQ/MSBQ methyltransferase
VYSTDPLTDHAGAIRSAFDAMARSYDDLEPWYVHLYARLAALVRAALGPREGRAAGRALDVGCGTGFATALLLDLGYTTHGLDLSPALLAVARARLPRARLVEGDARRLPYAAAAFDAVVCCGSTLSFVPDARAALAEIARVLVPGGRVLVEVEQKWTLDLAWTLLSGLAGDALGYGVAPRALWRALRRPLGEGCWIAYPLAADDGRARTLPLRLFTVGELRAWLVAAGLAPRRAWGVHAVTNLLPSTVLHRPRPGRVTRALFRALSPLDAALGAARWAPHVANSLVVLAERV